jgi:3-methyladenine DNA glycosylase AlkD
MKNVIETRNMHTAIHEIYLINSKPMTSLKAFQELEDGINEENNWNIIDANCEFLGEINYRNVTEARHITIKGIKYNILNNHSYDIY